MKHQVKLLKRLVIGTIISVSIFSNAYSGEYCKKFQPEIEPTQMEMLLLLDMAEHFGSTKVSAKSTSSEHFTKEDFNLFTSGNVSFTYRYIPSGLCIITRKL